ARKDAPKAAAAVAATVDPKLAARERKNAAARQARAAKRAANAATGAPVAPQGSGAQAKLDAILAATKNRAQLEALTSAPRGLNAKNLTTHVEATVRGLVHRGAM